jgi:trans-feruloyl-CoA hydratase/vanillin synthase
MTARPEPWGENVLVELDDGIAWVSMNRPAKRNAMNPALIAEMKATVDVLATDERCRVFVLTGTGESFTAGMDLREYFQMTDAAPDTVLLSLRRANEEWQWRRLRDYPKPTIAMVNGWCFGGGFTPLVACDLALAAEDAVFGLSEINWGILPAGNVTKAVTEVMNQRDALYYIMTGESFDGRRARELGVVNLAVPRAELRARTRWRACCWRRTRRCCAARRSPPNASATWTGTAPPTTCTRRSPRPCTSGEARTGRTPCRAFWTKRRTVPASRRSNRRPGAARAARAASPSF